MEGIILGQYIPGNSFLHRLDPRTKMILLMVLVGVIFLLKTKVEYIGFGALLIFLYFLAGVSKGIWRSLRPGIYLIIFTLMINMIFTPGHVILNLGIVSLTREGFILGLTMGFRLAFLISLSSLITLTTSPVCMTDGLELLLKPFKRIGIPASELAMMMNIALRFIPTFWDEFDKIKKAQISRGADFDSWHLGRRVKYMTAILVPLLVSAFRKADELSIAMEARGYVVGAQRTSLHILQFSLRDYLSIIIVLILSSFFTAFRYRAI